MNIDTVLVVIAAVGTYIAKPALAAMGWVGLAVLALSFVVT